MDSRCMEIAALGRPLYPGMLYDCRSDSFIPGVTLWNKNALRDDLDVRPKPKTHLDFAASDSLSEKANLLDINASLEASFLSGLVEVGGSAKYLLDTKSSTRQCRVTMQYSQTTKFEQLTMKELGNITYPEVFDQKTATHVVTAVLYGAQVFMVFDYTSAENESKQEIEGNLHALVKKVPNFSLDGEASLNMTEDEKKMAKNISVKFYGDIELEENPTTYKEALDVYKKVPALMKQQQDKGVPLTVWLYPLNLLDSKAAELVREICLNMVCETESLLEDLDEMERICKDLMKRQITDEFPDLKNRLLKFHALHKNYKCSFKNALFRVLPAIRGGRQEDKALGDILNIHYRSPFNVSNMSKWLDDITSELNILSSYTSGLKDLAVIKSSGSLNSICLHPDVDAVVCLSFTSLNYEDAYLAALEEFKKSEAFTMLRQTSERDFILHAAQPWFTSPDISARMKQNLSLFTTFSMANKNEKRIKFIIASISDPSNPGTSIQLYQNGSLKNPKFQPVSKPPKPVVETSDGKVTLKLSKSPTGETVHFRVEYRLTPSTDSETDVEEWTTIDTSNMQNIFTLAGLKQEEQYWVRYRAVSNEGISDASDSVHFIFRRKLNVTVDQWNFSMPTLINEQRTKIMTTIGMSRWSPSTIMSEVTNVVNNPIIPYTEEIHGGMALYLQGVVSAKTLLLAYLLGLKGDDITFHFSRWFNIDEFFGQNSEMVCCEISKGSAFDIFIVKNTEGYEVYINGQRSPKQFNHRIPMENLTTLVISGDVIMNTIGIVANWSTSTFGKEIITGISRTKSSDIQSDVPHPVCNPMMVNGLEYCSFKHRILVDNVTTLYIRGDIFMNTFALTEVEDINLKVTNPANI
ncbi:cytolytic toxin-alpha-like isoform X2 [Hemibagrus wyckioides]|uniref:cytolytic toxin-alpha-like isoform X2 n=1 Tax=Hemibagrus wyckioides TaxID=337641 RepID=UPI00266BB00E|nr:cytolytic toxin-alpha-like isoform X2 [Hemibagrus wyckioides]